VGLVANLTALVARLALTFGIVHAVPAGPWAAPANTAAKNGQLILTSASRHCMDVGTCGRGDAQGARLDVNPGALTITTPYSASDPFVLPDLTLSTDGTYLSGSAQFPSSSNPDSQQLVVTSTLAGDPGWTLKVSASNLTDGAGGTISSSGLGLTDGQLIDTGTFPGTVAFTNLPAHNPSPSDPDDNRGLGSEPQTWASAKAGDGAAVIEGTLTVLAPTSTPAGTYGGTISLSVS
jgi:hypothetical protein